jgi:hypothetical protein
MSMPRMNKALIEVNLLKNRDLKADPALWAGEASINIFYLP